MTYYRRPHKFEVITDTEKLEIKAYDFEFVNGCVSRSFWGDVGGRGPSFKMITGVKEINRIQTGRLYVPETICYDY